MARFEGKWALVTGAARGIGQAIAVKLAEQGADIALCDLQADWLEETAGKVRELGRKVLCFSADVSQGAAVAAVIEALLAETGRIDILVNNAGITKDTLILRMGEEDWDAVLDINLKGTFLFTKAVAKVMTKQRSGAIVNVASVIGLIGNAGQANYAASKAGVIALTKSVAKELAKRQVRVNAVAPGFIETKMTDQLPEAIRQEMLKTIPMGRFGSPRDVADVVAYLASDEAAYVTGQTLAVCGGMVTA